MAGRPRNDQSLRSIAARLSVEFGEPVTQKSVRVWKDKGYPLDDTEELKRRLRNQERVPGIAKDKAVPDESEDESDASPSSLDIDGELKRLQSKLLKAQDYESARTIRMQIAGVRDVLKSLREQGYYVTKESQIRDGMTTGEAIKALVLKIPSDLPQQIIGLDYADAVSKCEDYAYGILTSLAECREGKPE